MPDRSIVSLGHGLSLPPHEYGRCFRLLTIPRFVNQDLRLPPSYRFTHMPARQRMQRSKETSRPRRHPMYRNLILARPLQRFSEINRRRCNSLNSFPSSAPLPALRVPSASVPVADRENEAHYISVACRPLQANRQYRQYLGNCDVMCQAYGALH